jgi:hypothetical protein
MRQKRKFTRIGCSNKAVVEIDNVLAVDVRILNISLNGALFELMEFFTFKKKDRWRLTFRLPQAGTTVQLDTEVVHARDNLVGVQFINADNKTLAHLEAVIETGTVVQNHAHTDYVFPP